MVTLSLFTVILGVFGIGNMTANVMYFGIYGIFGLYYLCSKHHSQVINQIMYIGNILAVVGITIMSAATFVLNRNSIGNVLVDKIWG